MGHYPRFLLNGPGFRQHRLSPVGDGSDADQRARTGGVEDGSIPPVDKGSIRCSEWMMSQKGHGTKPGSETDSL